MLSHASLGVIAIVREADGEKEATALLYFIHMFTEMHGRCKKKIDGEKIIMGFSSITGIPDQIFTAASTRYSFFLLFICLFFPYHLFIHSSRAEWQGQQQHLMQSPPTPGAILHYDRAFRDKSLLRIKDRRMGGDAGL